MRPRSQTSHGLPQRLQHTGPRANQRQVIISNGSRPKFEFIVIAFVPPRKQDTQHEAQRFMLSSHTCNEDAHDLTSYASSRSIDCSSSLPKVSSRWSKDLSIQSPSLPSVNSRLLSDVADSGPDLRCSLPVRRMGRNRAMIQESIASQRPGVGPCAAQCITPS